MPDQIAEFHLRTVLDNLGHGVEADCGKTERFCVKVFAPWRLGSSGMSGQLFVTSSYQGISLGDGHPVELLPAPASFVTEVLAANGIPGVAPVLGAGFETFPVEVRKGEPRIFQSNRPAGEPVEDKKWRGVKRLAQCPWIAFPWAPGISLDTILRQRSLTPQETLYTLRSLTRSLAGLQERGLEHGDLIASKVMVDLNAHQVTLLDAGAGGLRAKSEAETARWRGKKLFGMLTFTDFFCELPLLGPGNNPAHRSDMHLNGGGDLNQLGRLALQILAGPASKPQGWQAPLEPAVLELCSHLGLRAWIRACIDSQGPLERFATAAKALEALDAIFADSFCNDTIPPDIRLLPFGRGLVQAARTAVFSVLSKLCSLFDKSKSNE